MSNTPMPTDLVLLILSYVPRNNKGLRKTRPQKFKVGSLYPTILYYHREYSLHLSNPDLWLNNTKYVTGLYLCVGQTKTMTKFESLTATVKTPNDPRHNTITFYKKDIIHSKKTRTDDDGLEYINAQDCNGTRYYLYADHVVKPSSVVATGKNIQTPKALESGWRETSYYTKNNTLAPSPLLTRYEFDTKSNLFKVTYL